MGKATRWLKSLLGMKKQCKNDKNGENEKKEKVGSVVLEKRWSFAKQNRNEEKQNKWFRDYIDERDDEQSKHAIAVAAATAAAADAAVAAAQAAVAVVRLTSQGRGTLFAGGRDRWAAVKIQSFFRGYLARRAHRALKGLVKLQAHVRGYLVRKRAAATLHSMQALIRAQAAVRSHRANQAVGKHNKIHSDFRPRSSVSTIERFDEQRNDQFHSKRLSTSYDPYNPYEGSPKIVEIDTFKPRSRSRSRRINPSSYDFAGEDCQYPTMSSPLPCPAPTRISIPDCRNMQPHDYDWGFYGNECRISTAQSTPRFSHSIRCNGSSTPTKSVCGDSFFRPYSNCPSYMADTQSFRAKLRSQSAPKQRPEDRSKKTFSLQEIMAARNSISSVKMQRSCSQVQEGLNL